MFHKGSTNRPKVKSCKDDAIKTFLAETSPSAAGNFLIKFSAKAKQKPPAETARTDVVSKLTTSKG